MTTADQGRSAESVLDSGAGARPSAPVVSRPGLVGRWPARRLAAAGSAAVLLAVVVQLFVGWNLTGAPTWALLTAITVVLGSLALATFLPLPGQGLALDVGCTPCAAGGGLLALAGMWLAISSAYDGGNASLGVALAGAALVRRVTEPTTCET